MRLILVILGALALVSCASSSSVPKTNTYLLRADVSLPDGEQTAPINVGIGRVVLADYLGGNGIVLRIDSDQVRTARQHLWAEPLDSAVRLYLRDAVSADLGYPVSADTSQRLAWDYRIDVALEQFHGSLDGTATLDASWVLMDTANEGQPLRYRIRRTAEQSEDGYDALVDAQKQLLNDLSAAIAASLMEMNTD